MRRLLRQRWPTILCRSCAYERGSSRWPSGRRECSRGIRRKGWMIPVFSQRSLSLITSGSRLDGDQRIGLAKGDGNKQQTRTYALHCSSPAMTKHAGFRGASAHWHRRHHRGPSERSANRIGFIAGSSASTVILFCGRVARLVIRSSSTRRFPSQAEDNDALGSVLPGNRAAGFAVPFAQTATLRGQVTDESGAVVPRAKVTLAGQFGRGEEHGDGQWRVLHIRRRDAGRLHGAGFGAANCRWRHRRR